MRKWIYTYLEKLIDTKYYKTKDDALKKLQMFAMFDDLNDDEYGQLRKLTEDKYAVA